MIDFVTLLVFKQMLNDSGIILFNENLRFQFKRMEVLKFCFSLFLVWNFLLYYCVVMYLFLHSAHMNDLLSFLLPHLYINVFLKPKTDA